MLRVVCVVCFFCSNYCNIHDDIIISVHVHTPISTQSTQCPGVRVLVYPRYLNKLCGTSYTQAPGPV